MWAEADTHREKNKVRTFEKTATEMERCLYTKKDTQGFQKLGERQGTEPSLGPSEEAGPCQHLDFRLQTPQNCETMHFCCPKPPSV